MNKERNQKLARNSILAALYVVMTLLNPLGWGPWQFRISEILLVIPFIKKEYTSGAIIGVAIANVFSPLGIIDIFTGVAVTSLAYILGIWIKNNYINAISFSIISAILVGLELNMVFQAPLLFTMITILLPQLVITFTGVWLFSNDKRIRL